MVLGAPVATIDAIWVGVWDTFLVVLAVHGIGAATSMLTDFAQWLHKKCRHHHTEADLEAQMGDVVDRTMPLLSQALSPATPPDLSMVLKVSQRRAFKVALPTLAFSYLGLYPALAMQIGESLGCPVSYPEVILSQGSSCTRTLQTKLFCSALSPSWALVIAAYGATLGLNLLRWYTEAFIAKCRGERAYQAFLNKLLNAYENKHSEFKGWTGRFKLMVTEIKNVFLQTLFFFPLFNAATLLNGLADAWHALAESMCTTDIPRLVFDAWSHQGNGTLLKGFPFPPPPSGTVATAPFNSSAFAGWLPQNQTLTLAYDSFMGMLPGLEAGASSPAEKLMLQKLAQTLTQDFGLFSDLLVQLRNLLPGVRGSQVKKLLLGCVSVTLKPETISFDFSAEKLFELLPACDVDKQALGALSFTLGFEITAVNLILRNFNVSIGKNTTN